MTPTDERQLLAIVPARAGSKGVIRKNMRLVGGKPLIAHTVEPLLNSGVVDRLVVSTNDPEILAWSRIHGVEVDDRPEELADDSATISQVAAYVAEKFDWRDDVAIFQPTSPFRTIESVERAVELFRNSGVDSLSTVVREPRLFWFDKNGDITTAEPLFTERVNRQFARHPVLRETGSIQLVRADVLRSNGQMVTKRHLLFEVDELSGIDIDTPEDLARVRRSFEKQTIVFRLQANARVGSGHLYHCLQLAEELEENDLRFLLKDCDSFVKEVLKDRGFTYHLETSLADDLQALAGVGRTLVVNDVLDTAAEEVLTQKSLGILVVNIEDLGGGAKYADWVVNALYPVREESAGHAVWGPRFATLRPEFQDLPPKEIRQETARVLITFGGTDPSRLGPRCAAALRGALDEEIRVVVGPGAPAEQFPSGVEVLRDVKSMAAEMINADVVLTSGGRTVYEAAATGTPVVVLAQNAREATHAHLNYEVGTIFLGIGRLVPDEQIVTVVQRLLADWDLRNELSARLRASIDGQGAERIANGIRQILRGL